MKTIFLIILFMLISNIALAERTTYYYSNNQRIYREIDTTKVMIKFDNLSIDDAYQLLLRDIPEIELDTSEFKSWSDFGLFDLKNLGNYDNLLSFLNNLDYVTKTNPVMILNDTLSTYVNDRFVCQFDQSIPSRIIDSLANYYNLTVFKDEYIENLYLLELTDKTESNLFELANLFYELEFTVYSHPDFTDYMILDSYNVQDLFYTAQLHLKRNIDYDNHGNGVWKITTGDQDIIVAIMDEGIAFHEDLDSNNFVTGLNIINGTSDVTPYLNEHHGNAMAGVIFGLHNNPIDDYPPDKSKGYNSIAGLAPDCKIMPIKAIDSLGYMISHYQLACGFIFAYQNGADVINCSWSLTIDTFLTDHLDAAIDSAYYFGRSGLGTAIVFSSGNHAGGNPGIQWPKNKGTVLSVGAVNLIDILRPYSNYDSTLDLVAVSSQSAGPYPGMVWSHDLMDSIGHNTAQCLENCSPGDNNVNYTCTAGMTSMAAAFTSGAAAMVLSRRWDLPVAMLYDVLKNSSDTVLYWGTINRPTDGYGHGRLNIMKALLSVSRGDANCDGEVLITDINFLISYLYQQGPVPEPDILLGDANCNGLTNIQDITYLINYLYQSGPPPPITCYEY